MSLLIFCILEIIKIKKENRSCKTTNELYNNFFSVKEKYEYINLHKTRINEKFLLLSSNKKRKIYCQKYLYSKINFLLTLSKFIDYKINSNNQKYRSKNGKILIEQIASVVAYSVLSSGKCNLFDLYKKLSLNYNLKQKEQKIFKFLLGYFLLKILYEIECEIIEIADIIAKGKTTNKIKKFKKQLFFAAEIYAIKKYNPSSSKLLSNENFDYDKLINNLFKELSFSMEKEKIIISYLSVIYK